jgi:hypothetical protein
MSKVVVSWSVQRASTAYRLELHENGLTTFAGEAFHLTIEEMLQFHQFVLAQLLKWELERNSTLKGTLEAA